MAQLKLAPRTPTSLKDGSPAVSFQNSKRFSQIDQISAPLFNAEPAERKSSMLFTAIPRQSSKIQLGVIATMLVSNLLVNPIGFLRQSFR
jgi:hypothetical protein